MGRTNICKTEFLTPAKPWEGREVPSKDALYVHVFTILHTFFEEKMPTISSFFGKKVFSVC